MLVMFVIYLVEERLILFCYSPDEMYYFAPKNPQNNKSSIVGQRLDVTIFEDFLNTAPVKIELQDQELF